jgi:hypothetical protein
LQAFLSQHVKKRRRPVSGLPPHTYAISAYNPEEVARSKLSAAALSHTGTAVKKFFPPAQSDSGRPRSFDVRQQFHPS